MSNVVRNSDGIIVDPLHRTIPYLTKYEIRYTDAVGGFHYYPFNGAGADDPLTIYVDESRGIPSRTGTAPNYIYDYTSPNRLRVHLDKTAHP